MNRLQKKILTTFGACFILHVAAIVLTGLYLSSGRRSYTEPVRWETLSAGMSNLSLRALGNGVGSYDWLVLLAIGAGAFLVLSNKAINGRVIGFLAAQPIIFSPFAAGLVLWVALPFELTRLDGEWFEEGTPFLLSSSAWLAACAIMAVIAYRHRRPAGSRSY
jgi:hypothetical protein